MAIVLVGCGGPILQNAPKPDPAVVAGAAAAIAGAATLADPAAAAKRQEENKGGSEKRLQNVKATVPADVFDRLDDQKGSAAPRKAGSGSAVTPVTVEPNPDDGTPLP